jgi:2-polyprenyl-6-methoxyphenol hydroxylase-like FAD-dependent oxidoreductase
VSARSTRGASGHSTHIDETPSGVRVSFASGTVRDFDLLIAADGLHSRVREVAFGPEDEFEHYLGYKVAAFEASGYHAREDLEK